MHTNKKHKRQNQAEVYINFDAFSVLGCALACH